MAILTQTGGASAAGDLTNAIGNPRLSLLCPASDGTVSTSIVSDVLTRTHAEVLSIIGPAYNVATAEAKTVVKVHATDIAIYRCYQRVTEFRNDRGEPIVKPDYVDAVAALKEIAKGIRDMGDETTTGKAVTVSGVVNYSTKAFIVETAESTTGPTGGF
jgi:phage gp36-like protein